MIHGWHNKKIEKILLPVNSLPTISNIDNHSNISLKRKFIRLFVLCIVVIEINAAIIYAEEQMRSSSLKVEKTIDGDTERIDYVDENGNITYAANKHYATIIRVKNGNTLLEKYLDADGKPAVQSLGHYAVLREYNDEGQNYKITYLGLDGNPVLVHSGYSIVVRTFNSDGYIDSEMYYDTKENPVKTSKYAFGCLKDYTKDGKNIRITYLDQNNKPTMSGQGFSIVCRTFYEDGEWAGEVKEEYYYDEDYTPINLSLGQYGVLKEYDEFGRETVVTYLDAGGSPIITNEGYSVVKKTYNEDDSIKTEKYYDTEGNSVSLSEGQHGYHIVDGNKVYFDSKGHTVFSLRNYLYSNQNIVIFICMIVVFVAVVFDRKINAILLVLYIIFIFYMTFIFRKPGSYKYNLKPFWSYAQFWNNNELRWEILNNIFLFIPLGTILSRIYPQKRTLLFIIGFSFFIELMQLMTRTGLCEIDDLISNTIGGVIGFIIGIVLCSLKKSYYSKRYVKNRK